MAELYGKPATAELEEGYDVPEEYSGQGDDRMIRVLSFLYTVANQDPTTGLTSLEPREAKRGDVVTLEQMGLIAQAKGEKSHSFYTDEEREKVEEGQDPDAPVGDVSSGGVSAMGEYELAEYIKDNNLTVNDTVALAGNDKDLAHRILQAENIATDGEPRKGVESGLTAIIEG